MNDRPRLIVELDIFSGRPNPSWELVGPEAEEVLRKIRAGGPQTAPPGGPGGLGYRGFTLHIGADGNREIVRVGAGTIEANGEFRVDVAQAIEGYLIRTMPAEMRRQFSAVLPQLER